ncbi:MAG: hypothetical protein NT040_19205 [Bacteroidetes bacterium]|nr:hypothetical protein [Bacteroidota bacterium]
MNEDNPKQEDAIPIAVKPSKPKSRLWPINERIIKSHGFHLFSISIGVIGLVLAVITHIMFMSKRDVDVQEIRVGIAPFQITDIADLEDKYLLKLKNSNIFLRDQNSEFRLTPFVPRSGGYEGVIENLKAGNIKIAFVSQALYWMLVYNKLCNLDSCRNITHIGYKKEGSYRVYYSGVLYNKKYTSSVKMFLDELVDSTVCKSYYKDKYRYTFILNDDENSTSTHVFPEVFLLEKGINLRSENKHISLSRTDMKWKIIQDTSTISFGFISHEDFERIPREERNSLEYRRINFPIPYDAVLVNSDWWNDINPKKKMLIFQALNTNPLGFDYTNCRKGDSIFRNFLFSGVIYEKGENNIAYAQIPDKQFDIFGFKKYKDADTIQVKLVTYITENLNTRSILSLKQIDIDSGKMIYCNGKYNVFPGKSMTNLFPGIHVLLQKTVPFMDLTNMDTCDCVK